VGAFVLPCVAAVGVGRAILRRAGRSATSSELTRAVLLLAVVPFALLSLAPLACI
jgi:hypothetical protein